VTPLEYDYLRRLLKERSGLVLSHDKQYLVESRLMPVARRAGLGSLSDLVHNLKRPSAGPLIVDVVEAMTTNETFFFRDRVPFDHVRDAIVPALLQARSLQKRIRVWCAAASTGQEPYSLAMGFKEMGASLAGWRIEILATDISAEVLEKAKSGVYSQFEVQRGLPIQLLIKYFTQVGDCWQLSPEIKAMVQFRPFNLLNDFAPLGVFDLLFCRNVLIYFDQESKRTCQGRAIAQGTGVPLPHSVRGLRGTQAGHRGIQAARHASRLRRRDARTQHDHRMDRCSVSGWQEIPTKPASQRC
jgi:chemotaxis protein methyltransferase CheR